MSDANLPERRLRAGDADRDWALTAIQRGYEAGRLDLHELRERQDKALRVLYTDELPALVDDLPEGGELAAAPSAPLTSRPEALPATGPANGGFTVSIMSGRDIVVESGTRELGNFAWWGGNTYDLTKAMGPGRIVVLNLSAVMAGSDIYVPPGVRVLDQSLAIMAGNDIEKRAQGDGSNGTLVLKGFLWWAGNDIKLSPGD